jgi:DNA (cytosine-5)-methyltransferase 1
MTEPPPQNSLEDHLFAENVQFVPRRWVDQEAGEIVATYGVKLERSDLLLLDEHPDACTEGGFTRWCEERIQAGARLAVDLFAGAGGLSLGLSHAGWTVAASVDNNTYALRTHRANFPGLALNLNLGDVRQRNRLVRMLASTEIDLIAGGPPCQPFSRAGRSKIRSLVNAGLRDSHDERKELWQAYVDVVRRVKPRAVIMENVPDMALGDDLHVVRTIVDQLENAGYRTDMRLVDAYRYGVPQHRKRLIILARRDSDAFPWPEESAEVSLQDAIYDLPRLKKTTGDRQLPYTEPEDLSEFAALMRKGADGGRVWDHMTRPVRPDDYLIFEQMTSRTLYADIDPALRRYKADTFDDKYKRLDWRELSRSITAHIAKDGYWYIHPEEHRTLTVREAARIQTFPDWFRFSGTRSHAFQQIGNAVPPLLGQAAVSALRPLPDQTKQRTNPWRALRQRLTVWAEKQQQSYNWCLLPGPRVGPAVATLVAIVDPSPFELMTVNHAINEVAQRSRISKRAVDLLRRAQVRASTITAVDQVREKQDSGRIWSHPEDLPEMLQLLPAKTALLRLLCGDDILLTTQPVLRVTARVLGTQSDKINKLTDGRIDLARLVGGGVDAPLRMGALRLIGQALCNTENPICVECPLMQKCCFAQGKEPNGLLF